MRRSEYEKLAKAVWETSNSFSNEFKTLTAEMQEFASLMNATAVSTVGHIRRGNIQEGDPLIRYMNQHWFLPLHSRLGKFIKKL